MIGAWELGRGAPTYVELERLAYDVLKRPLAMFFFPAPPEEPALEEFFRTLPGFDVERLTPETRHAIRRARADQLGLAEPFNGRSPAARSLVRDVHVSPQGDVVHAAAAVRQVLGVSIARQKNGWKTERDALEGWRSALDESGVIVFKKDGIRQRGLPNHDSSLL